MDKIEINHLVILVSIVFLIGVIIVISIFLLFMKKKSQLALEKLNLEQKFQAEIAKSKIEIQDATLKNIGWEIHDNIGQMMSVAKLNLHFGMSNLNEPNEKLTEAATQFETIIGELRALSHTLNHSFTLKKGLLDAVETEVNRINKIGKWKCTLMTEGSPIELRSEVEILLFRIIQEFVHNSMHHARCTAINISVFYQKNALLEIILTDNGIGFDVKKRNGFGISSITERAALLNAELHFQSNDQQGTTLQLKYNHEKKE